MRIGRRRARGCFRGLLRHHGAILVRVILIPLALAILISFVLTPLVTVVQRIGIGRVPSVIVVLFFSLVLIGGVSAVVVAQLAELTKTLPDHAGEIKAKVESIRRLVSSNEESRLNRLFDDVTESVDTETMPPPADKPQPVVVKSSPSWVNRIQSYLSPAAEALGQAALTFILVVFMLLRREDLRNRAIRLLGQGHVTATTKAVDETSRRISRFLLAQFLVNSSFGIITMLGLILMGVPYAPLWGFIGFLMRYVPYIGTWIAVLPPLLFTFAVSDGWGATAGVFVLFLGLETLCNNFVEPSLYGPRLGLSEVAQLVATAFWMFLWGPVGLILAWPLTTCVLMVGKYVPQWRFLNVLLGDEPVLSPRVAFYQRLAAHDQDEATDIAEKALDSRPLQQVFDDLFVPALSQPREDSAAGLVSDHDLDFVVHAIEEVAEGAEDSKAEPAEDSTESQFAY